MTGRRLRSRFDFFGLNTYSRILVGEKDGDATQKIKQLGGNFQAGRSRNFIRRRFTTRCSR